MMERERERKRKSLVVVGMYVSVNQREGGREGKRERMVMFICT